MTDLLRLLALVAVALSSALTPGAPATHREGVISHMGSGFADDYLALPIGRGVTVRICGEAACRVMTSNDVGPNQSVHPDRIADVGVGTFEILCGCDSSAGLIIGEWTVVEGLGELPPTDTE